MLPAVDQDLQIRITDLVGYLRPASIWTGLVSFFLGSLLLGQAMAADVPVPGDYSAAALFLVVGVGLIGAALAVRPTGATYDPDIELARWLRLAVGGTAIGFLLLAMVVVLVGS